VSGQTAQLLEYTIVLDGGLSLLATATVTAAALSVVNL